MGGPTAKSEIRKRRSGMGRAPEGLQKEIEEMPKVMIKGKVRELPDEEVESDWGYDVKCPVCGELQTDLGETDDSDGDYRCKDCGVDLEIDREYSCDYILRYEPPTERRKLEHHANVLRRAQHMIWNERDKPRREKAKVEKEERRRAAPKHWVDFEWPEWVPKLHRESIEVFWSCFGRTPFSYLEDCRDQGAPAMGSEVTVSKSGCCEASGRYVHKWNNMGVLVGKDGRTTEVSVDGSGRVYDYPMQRGGNPEVADATPGGAAGVSKAKTKARFEITFALDDAPKGSEAIVEIVNVDGIIDTRETRIQGLRTIARSALEKAEELSRELPWDGKVIMEIVPEKID